MGNFDIQYAERLPSGRSGDVGWNINTETGYEAIGRATSGLGNVLAGIGEDIDKQVQAAELSTLKRQIDERGNKAFMDFELAQTDEQRSDIRNKFISDVQGMKSKRTGVNNALKSHLDETIPNWNRAFDVKALTTKKKQVDEQFEFNQAKLLEAGDVNGYAALLAQRRKLNSITQAEYDARIQSAPGDSLIAQARRKIDTDPEFTIATLENPETRKQLSIEQIDQADSIVTQAIAKQNRVNALKKEQQDKEQWEMYKKMDDGTLTREDLEKTILSADDKVQLWESFKAAQIQKRKTGISNIEEGDVDVLAMVNAIVDLKPDSLTPQTLYKLQEKGLGTKYIPGLVDRLQKNQEESNPIKKKYKSQLASVYEAGLFGKKKKTKTSDIYMGMQRKLDAFLKTNPTDQQAQAFFSTLIRDDVSYGHSFGDNELPGWDETPLEYDIQTPAGTKTTSINFGDIIEVDGELWQAVGREKGEVKWLKTKKRQ